MKCVTPALHLITNSGVWRQVKGSQTQAGSSSSSSRVMKWRRFHKVASLSSTLDDESLCCCKKSSCQVWLTPGNQYLTLLRPTTTFTLIHILQTAVAQVRRCSFVSLRVNSLCVELRAHHWICGGTVSNGSAVFSSCGKKQSFVVFHAKEKYSRSLWSSYIWWFCTRTDVWLIVCIAADLEFEDLKNR